jgi:predicted lipoprotein with Yx(FWY)xxD motif
MTSTRTRLAVLCIALVAVVVAVAAAAAARDRPDGSRAVVALGATSLGRVLVDGGGRTLYLFEKDPGRTSTCYQACATVWPPLLTTSRPRTAKGALASLLGTTRRNDGTLQVTYRGHPLYTYVTDTRRGQTAGQGLDQYGAEWYVLSRTGEKVESG